MTSPRSSSFVLASWGGQLAGVAAGVLLPSLLLPREYALLFQLRQIHLYGFFTFAFVLHAAILELGLSRGRRAIEQEAVLQRVSLTSVLLFATISAALCTLGVLAFADRMTPEARIGALSFGAMLPLLGLAGWASHVLLAAQRFDLLWRLVLVQMLGLAVGGLAGAYWFGFTGVLAGVGAAYLCAAGYGVLLGRRAGAVGFRFDGSLVRTLALVGIPQSIVALVAIASRAVDRNFAYLGYGEDLGGVFALAATFSLNTINLVAALAETSRPTINEECAASGRDVTGARLVGRAWSGFALAVAVTSLASLCLPALYPILFAEYATEFSRAVPLALAALCAACPAALSLHSQMYLVATKRPRLYLTPPLLGLAVVVAGNALGIALGWGVFGIVAVGAAGHLIVALTSLWLTGRHYATLRSRCASIVAGAFVIAGGAAIATAIALGAAHLSAVQLGTPPEWTAFGLGLVLATLGLVAWRAAQRAATTPATGAGTATGPAPDPADALCAPVSIIVPCHDRPALLRSCLSALLAQTDGRPREIVVVDSGSDPEIGRAIADFPGIRRIASAERLDAGPARNLGASRTAHPLVAFIDADCRADPRWLERMRTALAGGARIVGGSILDARPWSPAAAAAHFLQCADAGPDRPAAAVPYLPGCNLAMHRATFGELGGFDEGRGEDIRLTAAAARRWPGAVRFEPAMAVHHASSTSFRALRRRSRELGADRGRLGPPPRLTRTLGRSRPSALLTALARFVYIGSRTLEWHPRAVPRFVLFSPLVLVGLLRWGIGLAEGLASSERR